MFSKILLQMTGMNLFYDLISWFHYAASVHTVVLPQSQLTVSDCWNWSKVVSLQQLQHWT